MLIVVHRDRSTVVYATHRNGQKEDVLEAYPATDFGVLQTTEQVSLIGPLPAEFDVVREIPPAEAA